MFNSTSDAHLVRCAFDQNVLGSGGGSGGGMCNVDSNPTLVNCTFTRNAILSATPDAGPGAGMFNSGSNPVLVNCIFAGNRCGPGAGIFNSASNPLLTNCTIVGNQNNNVFFFLGGAGIYNAENSNPVLNSCIVWHNHFGQGSGTLSHQIYPYHFVAHYSCITNIPGPLFGTGNIRDDPLLVDADGSDGVFGTADDNLRLLPDSPCINTGDPDFTPQPHATDLDNHVRVLCGRVDMGAYEFGIGDHNCDRDVDLDDFGSWYGCMTGPATGTIKDHCQTFDFDNNTYIDLGDFHGFQNVFRGGGM
jgi:hypothetical protein